MARILVVDDEPNIRKLLAMVVEELGHEVREARNGPHALKLLEKHAFDLVLLDVLMPRMNGLETLRRLLRLAPQVKVIMVSGIADEHQALESLDLGACEYIRKPFDLDHVRRVLRLNLALSA